MAGSVSLEEAIAQQGQLGFKTEVERQSLANRLHHLEVCLGTGLTLEDLESALDPSSPVAYQIRQLIKQHRNGQ